MTQVVIDDIIPRTQLIAAASQTVFNTNWTANAATDVLVYARADGVPPDDQTQLVSSSLYTVTFIGGSQTVRVTFLSGRTLDDVITIVRNTPADRMNLYINTNFTPSMLNEDFGILTLVDQQAQMYDVQINPGYNVSATIDPIIDLVLPILEASQLWAMNASRTAIEAIDIPGGIAPAAGKFLVQQASALLPNAFDMGSLSSGILKQSSGGGIATPAIAVPASDYWAPGNTLTSTYPVSNTQVATKLYVDDSVSAITNGPFFVATPIPGIPSAVNFGALTSGMLKHVVTMGVSAPATAILDTDYYGPGMAPLIPSEGGTGVNNGSNTLTLAGTLQTIGAFASIFRMSGVTDVTFPVSGTLATTSQIPSVTPSALTKTDDTNVTLTLGGTPLTALLQAVSLTLGWTGILAQGRGGTGFAAFGTGIAAALQINAGSAGAPVLFNGALGTPSSGTLTNATGLPIGGISATGTPSNTTFLRGDGTWAAPSGSGTVNSGTQNQLAWYAANGTAVSGLATANNGILVTSAGGVPSIGNTVGAGLTMPSITFNSTSGIIGSATNDSAAAGSVGEFVSSVIPSGSGVSLTTATATNVTSISLTAGDWDVWGNVGYSDSVYTMSFMRSWVSSTSATLPDQSLYTGIATNVTLNAAEGGWAVPSRRFSLSGTTTIYLSGYAQFGSGTVTMNGGIYARRRR